MLFFLYRTLFTIIFIPGLIVFVFYVLITGKHRHGFLQRLGFLPARLRQENTAGCIWFHTVSAGEILIADALIREWRNHDPDLKVILSVINETGYRLAQEKGYEEALFYLPADLYWIIRRTVRRLAPKALVLIETELWPGLIHAATKSGCRCYLVNGRISPKNLRRSWRFRFFFRDALKPIEFFFMQSRIDAKRIFQLGADRSKVRVIGNVKFDKPARTITGEDKREIRKKLGIDPDKTRIIVIGSTHPTEEEKILGAFRKILEKHSDALLILAPRHVKRRDEIIPLIEKENLSWACWSSMNGRRTNVVLVDTMGELEYFYSIAHVVFVAGSLASIGGHNLIEPALLEKPILFGPHMENFKEVSRLFVAHQAAIQVRDADELAEKILMLLDNDEQCMRMSRKARRLALANQGAVRKTITAIMENLKSKTA